MNKNSRVAVYKLIKQMANMLSAKDMATSPTLFPVP